MNTAKVASDCCEHNPTTILYPSLRFILVNQLQKTIELLNNTLQEAEPSDHCQGDESPRSILLQPGVIPLSRVKDVTQICYQSPIALKLAKQWKVNPLCLAQEIITSCPTSTEMPNVVVDHLSLDRVCQYISLQAMPSGWIYLELTDQGIAFWLQTFIDHCFYLSKAEPPLDTRKSDPSLRNSAQWFEVQYTHARCCSMLRLADREGLISLGNFCKGDMFDRSSVQPRPFPWLTTEKILWLQHPLERSLIGQLFTIGDRFIGDWAGDRNLEHQQSGMKLACALSQQVHAFQAACPIWSEVRGQRLELAQARLGLTLICQTVLRSVLQEWIGIEAPVEL